MFHVSQEKKSEKLGIYIIVLITITLLLWWEKLKIIFYISCLYWADNFVKEYIQYYYPLFTVSIVKDFGFCNFFFEESYIHLECNLCESKTDNTKFDFGWKCGDENNYLCFDPANIDGYSANCE